MTTSQIKVVNPAGSSEREKNTSINALIKQVRKAVATYLTGPGASVAGNLALWSGVAGLVLVDAGFPPRQVLTADRTYYFRTDGSDSSSGLINAAGGAFLTPQAAFNAAAKIDFNGHTVTIQCGQTSSVTFAGQIVVPRMVGQATQDNLVLNGNASTPTNCVLTNAVSFGPTITVPQGAAITLTNFRVSGTNNGYGVYNSGGVCYYSGIDWGTCGQQHIFNEGGFTFQSGNDTISGGAVSHWDAAAGGYIKSQNKTTTASGTITFSYAFAQANQGGTITSNGNTFSGTYVGARYAALFGGSFRTTGSGPTYFPGNSPGFTQDSGTYDGVLASPSINVQTGNYTFTLSDVNNTVTANGGSAQTFTIPPLSSVPFLAGARIDLIQTGSGGLTIAAGSGVTILSLNSKTKLQGQFAAATLINGPDDNNFWFLVGNLQ